LALIRDVPPELMAALESGTLKPVVLCFVDWPSGAVRAHSGSGPMTWDGHTWHGIAVGDQLAGMITLPNEAASLAMVEGSATVGGSSDEIDGLLEDAEAARGRTVQVWFGGTTTPGGNLLIGEPLLVFTGTVGSVSDQDTPQGDDDMVRLVKLQLVSGPSQRSRAATHHSWEDQRRLDPADTAGRWVSGAIGNLVASLPRW